jgi:hypothetical protein
VIDKHDNCSKQDPVYPLPDELFLKVFSHFNLATLGIICRVSKEWKRLANDPILWKTAIYREIAFGNDKWAGCFGKDVVKDEDSKEEFSSLPWKDFIADCKKFKILFPEKTAKDTLLLVRLPKTLNGGLTLKNLSELAGKYFSNISSYILHELRDKSIDKSLWVLMTKDLLPGSKDKNYGEQQKIVAGLAEKSLMNYEVPGALEFAACILSQHFNSKKILFSNDSLIYTRCRDKVRGFRTITESFFPAGFTVYGSDNNRHSAIGVAALRKF